MSNCYGCNSSTHILRSFLRLSASELVGQKRCRFTLNEVVTNGAEDRQIIRTQDDAIVQVTNVFNGDLVGNHHCVPGVSSLADGTLLNEVTMDRRLSNSKRQLLLSAATSPSVEAYDETVDFDFKRDLEAWGKLSTLHKRFLLQAWEDPLPDKTDRIDSRRNRRFRRRA